LEIVIYGFVIAIWTSTFATPFLALAPICAPWLKSQFIILFVEISTMILWLAAVIAQVYYLPHFGNVSANVRKGFQAITALTILEWYVSYD